MRRSLDTLAQIRVSHSARLTVRSDHSGRLNHHVVHAISHQTTLKIVALTTRTQSYSAPNQNCDSPKRLGWHGYCSSACVSDGRNSLRIPEQDGSECKIGPRLDRILEDDKGDKVGQHPEILGHGDERTIMDELRDGGDPEEEDNG